MAHGTFTLPNGLKVRSQSKRRYVVVSVWNGAVNIYRRSDSLDTARKVHGGAAGRFLIDTVERRVIA